MGDYKLKTASDYEVPAHMRINTARKRFELLRFRHHVTEAKIGYNKLVEAMREKKKNVLKKVCLSLFLVVGLYSSIIQSFNHSVIQSFSHSIQFF